MSTHARYEDAAIEFTAEFSLDNDAFSGPGGPRDTLASVADQLRRIADNVEEDRTHDSLTMALDPDVGPHIRPWCTRNMDLLGPTAIIDLNGNTVGLWYVTSTPIDSSE